MLGDGIRRDIATISEEERTLFINAIRQLDDPTLPLFVYGNNMGHEGADAAGNITFWDMQEQIHKDAHAHGSDVHVGPGFIPWHRVLVNRFEALLRSVDPRLSLHYWDWTTDPRVATADRAALFTTLFMGSAAGNAGVPLQDFESTEITGDASEGIPGDGVHDHVWRDVSSGAPPIGADATIIGATDYTQFESLSHNAHDSAHGYIGGTLGGSHFSFHDPFVFLLHSNLDRLWATWQRVPGQAGRLNPATAYGTILADFGLPSTYFDEEVAPWSGGAAATDLEPWRSDVAQQVHINYLDPSIIIPASYDTAPHSSYFVVNQDTFSTSQVSVQSTFPSAFYLVYEGFEPKDLGVTGTPAPLNLPTFAFTSGGSILTTLSAINPVISLEDPLGAIDVPQRITIQYDLHFTGTSEFPPPPPPPAVGELPITMRATLNYNVDTGTGGAVVNVNEVAQTPLLLVNQPNPYMLKVDSTLSPPNPYWLSMDTRVFKVTKGQTIGVGPGAMTQNDPTPGQPNPANDFIKGVVANFNSQPNNAGHPFLALTADEAGSTLYLPAQDGGVNVYNYAVAKVRYVAPVGVPAADVRVFFRAFSTLVSALDYDHTSGSTGNYRRSGDSAAAVPLLGIESSEVASIPFFAAPRVNTNAGTAGAVSMTTQTDDGLTNTQTLNGGGAVEQVAYFGCWLDINQTDLRFPRNPVADPGGPNGPFTGTAPGNPLLSIQQLMNGFHQCLVAEVFFWPPGALSDPIQLLSTPASSDRLAQRNLSLVPSGNPHWPETHTVQHTFLLKPSPGAARNPTTFDADATPVQTAAAKSGKTASRSDERFDLSLARHTGPDELMILWYNVPRDSEVKIYLPEVSVDEILRLNALRQHPLVLEKLDDHTVGCKVADVTIIPLPSAEEGNLPGLLSVTLPPGIRTGQTFRLSAQQISGGQNKILGGFQMTIPVKSDPEILPSEIDKLAVLRYIQQSMPANGRWSGIFQRYLAEIAGRVRGLGGDPDKVIPSPNGQGMR